MTTIQLGAFLEAQHEVVHDVLAHRPRAHFDRCVLREAQDHHLPQGSHQGGDESRSSVFVQGRHGLRLKKCTELNSCHLEHML